MKTTERKNRRSRSRRDAILRGKDRRTPFPVERALQRPRNLGSRSKRSLCKAPSLGTALSPITRPLVVRTPPGAPPRTRPAARAGLGVRLRRPIFGSPEPGTTTTTEWNRRTQVTPEGVISPTDPTPDGAPSPLRLERSETPSASTGVLGHQNRARHRLRTRPASFGELPW